MSTIRGIRVNGRIWELLRDKKDARELWVVKNGSDFDVYYKEPNFLNKSIKAELVQIEDIDTEEIVIQDLDDICQHVYGCDYTSLQAQVQRDLRVLYDKGVLRL